MSSSRPRAIFCSLIWPRYPGHSGGEIRDFHLVRHLSGFLDVEFFALHDTEPEGRDDLLRDHVTALHTPSRIAAQRPDLAPHTSAPARALDGLVRRARQAKLPVAGRRYHLDAELHIAHASAWSLAAIRESVARVPPRYVFVSPQINPLGLLLGNRHAATLVLASYDVEQIRMRRIAAAETGLAAIAQSLETRRAARFEADNLRAFDGVIAVSALDRSVYAHHYGVEPERLVVVDNSVDVDYFGFAPRTGLDPPRLIYVGNFGYPPNAQAALRLLRQIIPIVRRSIPSIRVNVVGARPTAEMLRESDGERVIVTGRVDDVRPHLAAATVACFPLVSGSGTKYKVLETLAAGVPLVCSPLAAEGLEAIHEQHLLIADLDADIAAAIVRALAHRDASDAMARRGRALVEGRYAWAANLAPLEGWLRQLRPR